MAGGVFHVHSRGNRKEDIFRTDEDRREWLKLLRRVIKRHDWTVLAWCLMGNHYHLIVQTKAENLSHGMRMLNGCYAMGFNKRHGLTGHVFGGRFHSSLVQQDSYLLTALRYVARNPVKIGWAKAAHLWPWSSHAGTLGLRRDPVVDRAAVLRLFRGITGGGVADYARFVDGAQDTMDLRPESPIHGDDAFVDEHLPHRPTREHPRKPWWRIRRKLPEVLGAAPDGSTIARAVRTHGFTLGEIAETLGCHPSTVSRRLARWELARAG